MKLRCWSLICLLVAATPVLGQSVVWDNGPNASALGLDISGGAVADDFRVIAPMSFNRIRFWAESGEVLFGSFSGTVGWAIHDAGAIPGAILFSGSTNQIDLTLTGDSVGDANIYQLEFDVGQINLVLAGTYWLQLRENAIGSPWDGQAFTVNWVPSTAIRETVSRFDTNEVNPQFLSQSVNDRAFQLLSAVPEPTTLLLGAVALGGATAAGWKKRRRG